MGKIAFLLGIVVLGLPGSIQASVSYSGVLSVTDGSLITQGTWWSRTWPTPASLRWEVRQIGSGWWHYEYTLTVPCVSIGCVIIEASDDNPGPAFTAASLFSPASNPPGWADSPFVGTSYALDYAYLPGDLYGIRFCATVDPMELTISFDSDRKPVWGDFYARSCATVGPTGTVMYPGGLNLMYNAGFTSSDTDPLTGPSGSELRHLLVPDSVSYIPAPGAIVLAGLGAALVGLLRRRRML